MLEHAGIPLRHAAVAATREELRSTAAPFFLGEEPYEVPAVLVEPRDGEPLWLFAGSPRHAPAGLVPGPRMGAPAILLSPAPEHTRLPGGQPELATGPRVSAEIALDGDSASMRSTVVLRGTAGLVAAEDVRNMEASVQQIVGRQIAGQIFPGWTLQEVDLVDLQSKGRPLTLRGLLSRQRALESAGEIKLLGLPLAKSELMARYGDRDERTLPLQLNELSSSLWEAIVDPGEGYRFTEVPETVRVRHMLIEYELSFRLDAGRMVIRRELVQRPGTVAASQFGAWRELLRKLDVAEETNLRLAPATVPENQASTLRR